jgi:hypothetical protein
MVRGRLYAWGVVMSAFEPGSPDLPECRCGHEMQIARDELTDRTDAEIRIYKCSICQHEMRLTVWSKELFRLSVGRSRGLNQHLITHSAAEKVSHRLNRHMVQFSVEHKHEAGQRRVGCGRASVQL